MNRDFQMGYAHGGDGHPDYNDGQEKNDGLGMSEEAKIDRELDGLIQKMVVDGLGALSTEERSLYDRLSVRRAQLMQPRFLRRLDSLKKLKAG